MRVRPAGRLLSPGRRRMDWLLSLPIIDGPIPWIVYGLASAIVVALLIRRPTRRWLLAAGLGISVCDRCCVNGTPPFNTDPRTHCLMRVNCNRRGVF